MQSRLDSLLEQCQGIAIKYLIGLVSQFVVFPLVGVEASLAQNLVISVYFTAISLVVGYTMRRYHNKKTVMYATELQKTNRSFTD